MNRPSLSPWRVTSTTQLRRPPARPWALAVVLVALSLALASCEPMVVDGGSAIGAGAMLDSCGAPRVLWTLNGGGGRASEAAREFNAWYPRARQGEVLALPGVSALRRDPWGQGVQLRDDGTFQFRRRRADRHTHSMIELQFDRDATAAAQVTGGRALSLGEAYRFEMTVAASGDLDWDQLPWLLVFQGHAFRDRYKRVGSFNPPLAVVISRGFWEVHVRGDDRQQLPRDKKYQRDARIRLGRFVPGRPATIDVELVWGSSPTGPVGQPPRLDVWFNGEMVHSESRVANFFRVELDGVLVGPYVGMGAYLPAESVPEKPIVVAFRHLAVYEVRAPACEGGSSASSGAGVPSVIGASAVGGANDGAKGVEARR